MGQIADNLLKVRERIEAAALRSGRDPKDIILVAVSKGQGLEKIEEAIAAGVQVLGENFVQEAKAKIEALRSSGQALNPDIIGTAWHFVGHLQTNKAKQAVELFDLIHSVDSVKLARELARQAEKLGKRMPVLIQVNISQEATKFGVEKDEALVLIKEAAQLANLEVQGLMTIGPLFDEPEMSRPYYVALRHLRDEMAASGLVKADFKYLSMGMSLDYQVAIEEGANLVRVGTAIFGPRGQV